MNAFFVSSAYALVDLYRDDFGLSDKDYFAIIQDLVALLNDYTDTYRTIEPSMGHFIDWVRKLSDDETRTVAASTQRVIQVMEHAHRRYGDDFPGDPTL